MCLLLCSAENQTQGLVYAKQALYQLSYILNPITRL